MSDRTIHPGQIYSSADVAWLLFGKLDVEWFYRYRRHEGVAEGFPAPVSTHGHPRWSGVSLLSWRDRPKKPVMPKLQGATIVDIRHALAARSKNLSRRA